MVADIFQDPKMHEEKQLEGPTELTILKAATGSALWKKVLLKFS